MNHILSDLNNIPEDIHQALLVLSGWSYTTTIIGGRLIISDGEYSFANKYDSTSQHEIRGKDMTQFVIDHKHLFIKGTQRDEFENAYSEKYPTRIRRYHEDTKYLQILKG